MSMMNGNGQAVRGFRAVDQAEPDMIRALLGDVKPTVPGKAVLGQLVRLPADPVAAVPQRPDDREQHRGMAGPERRIGSGHVFGPDRVGQRPQFRAEWMDARDQAVGGDLDQVGHFAPSSCPRIC